MPPPMNSTENTMHVDFRHLEAHADRDDVQREIQGLIKSGTVRVVPGPQGIQILPQCVSPTDRSSELRPGRTWHAAHHAPSLIW